MRTLLEAPWHVKFAMVFVLALILFVGASIVTAVGWLGLLQVFVGLGIVALFMWAFITLIIYFSDRNFNG